MSHDIVSHLDDHDVQVVAQAPVLVFLLVSAADGTIDKCEIKRFASLLSGTSFSDLMAVMQRARLSIVDALRQLSESQVDYLAELQRIAQVLDSRLPENLAQQVKTQLYRLGHSVATSSDQVTESVGGLISEQERIALKVIAGLICIDESQC